MIVSTCHKLRLLLLTLAVTAASVFSVHAQWQNNGIPVTDSTGALQALPAVCEDGHGGGIIAWTDLRNGNLDIYAQRIDAAGNRLWGNAGAVVCADTNVQRYSEIVSDGSGGAIIVWRDHRITNYPLFAQRLDSQGNPLWVADGVHAGTTRATFPDQGIVDDASGGAIMAWMGESTTFSVYSQRLDGSGNPRWAFPWGNPAYSVDVQPLNSHIAPDGFGGVLIAWYLDVGGTSVQRLDPDGNKLWGPDGVEVYDIRGINLQLTVAEDSLGGAFAAWCNNFGPLHVQHVSAAGQVSWIHNGIVLPGSDAVLNQLVPDGQAGVICIWSDNHTVQAVRLDQAGTLVWGASPVVLSAAGGVRLFYRAASDGQGGAVAVWTDKRDFPEQDIYVQRVDSLGNVLWLTDGAPVCTAPGYQDNPRIVSDGAGGAIAVWEDERSAFTAIYAQRVDDTGAAVPTCLASQTAFFAVNAIHVEWIIEPAATVPGFIAYREGGGSGGWQQLAGIQITGDGTHFRLIDRKILLGESYRYRVYAENENGPGLLFETDAIEAVAPCVLAARSFPNPFNPATTIRYTLPEPSIITICIYSVDGALVRILESGIRPSGQHDVVWDGRDTEGHKAGSGVYIYRLRAGSRSVTGKLVLLK